MRIVNRTLITNCVVSVCQHLLIQLVVSFCCEAQVAVVVHPDHSESFFMP